MRSLLVLIRGYGHTIMMFHLAALMSVLVVMVFLHNSTCNLEAASDQTVLSAPDTSQFESHSVRKRHLMSLTLPPDIATSNNTLPDISLNVTLTPDLREFMLHQPIINTQTYSYMHNPEDKCRGRDLKFVILIPSARYHFDQRRKVRMSTLRHLMMTHPDDGAVVFFLGVPPSEITSSKTIKYQRSIDVEAKEHGDIVQQTYMDTHRTLTTKAVAMLHWVNRFCNNAKYVIKLDDDVRFDNSDFLEMVERATGGKERAILGQVFPRSSAVVRDPVSRFFVSEREYPASHFPPYVMGGLLAFPMSTARLLYEGILRVKVITLDDVYVTGLVAKAMNISLVSDEDFDFEHHSCGAIRV